MIDKKRLKAISALNSLEQTWLTNDIALEVYTKKLADFSDSLPLYEDAVRVALSADDNDTVYEQLTALWDKLVQIRADKMADDLLKKIGEAKNLGKVHKEAHIEKIFNAASSLSIEIQMAIYGTELEEQIKLKPANHGPERIIRILAVDDSAFFLQNLKTCLQDTPYKLHCVVSGSAALRFLEKNMVDLFILDIEMPVMNGYEIATEIRKKGEKAPIIFLTGNAKKEYVLKAMKAGAVDFIVKPIKKEQVLEKIAKYI